VIRQFGYVTKADVDNEVRALKKLCQNQHPNIVQVFDYGQLNTDGTIHFIDMELCDISLGNYLLGQELKDVISWTTVREQEEIPTHAYNILQQILNGLLFIHCLDEVHRDLSPQNGISSFSSPAYRQYCSATDIGRLPILASPRKARRKSSSRAVLLVEKNVIERQNCSEIQNRVTTTSRTCGHLDASHMSYSRVEKRFRMTSKPGNMESQNEVQKCISKA
jgi:serine/threonine protein kinase